MPDPDRPVALVTGASSGIGEATSKHLAKAGYTLMVTARRSDRLESLVGDIEKAGGHARPFVCDITDPGSVHSMIDEVLAHSNRLDVLVNNAGVYPDEGVSVFAISLDTLRDTFSVNTFGPFMMCQAFVPMMMENDYGRIVNVSSGYGAITQMGGYTAAYKMSKVSLNALTRIVASETRRYNIKVNAADPGWVATDMGGKFAPRTIQEGTDTIVWLATLPDDGPTNGFFYDREMRTW